MARPLMLALLARVLVLLAASPVVSTYARSQSRLPDFGAIILNESPSEELDRCPYDRGQCTARLVAPEVAARGGVNCMRPGHEFGWRAVSSTKGAKRYLQKLRRAADTRFVSSCKDSSCLSVVPVIFSSTNSANSGEGIAVCEVEKILGEIGPPANCEPIYSVIAGKESVLVSLGKNAIGCLMGGPDFKLMVVSIHQVDRSQIASKVVDVLSSPPFRLKATIDGNDIIGTRSHAVSEVIAPYREWVTIRVGIHHGKEIVQDDQHIAWVGVTISSTILVNRQNTSGREDWTAPLEAQEKAYLSALESKIKDHLNLCVGGKWNFDRIYNCDVPSHVNLFEFRPPRWMN